jgi:hypothetical protein
LRRRRLAPILVFTIAFAALASVARLVAQHTIRVVEMQGLLPRWDLATHLVLGWGDYHYLTSARIDRLLWDLWLQGYWPPVLSIFQIPFYLVLGGGLSAGLWSSMAAFVLTGVVGSALLWRQWKAGALLPAGVFLALLMSSPFLLAYASVTMAEMLGAAIQLIAVFCYAVYREQSTARTARAFAISLTVLFFTKYNYFFLLAVPLVIHEWLRGTAGNPMSARLASLLGYFRRVFSTPIGILLVAYVAFLFFISRTGGFEFHALGRRIAVHTIGNTGHVVLYALLARVWFLHRRGRIDWAKLLTAHPLAGPLLRWFVVPVTIWFAVPYPNHIRDFANLVFNRPLGDATIGAGAATYAEALRGSYFYSPAVLLGVVVVFVIAAARYGRRSAWMQCLIIAVPVQFAATVFHQTRFPRFLLLTVVLLCLAAAGEIGYWSAGSKARRVASWILAPVILILGITAARIVVTEERFRLVAFDNYTDSGALRDALGTIRRELTPEDRLAIVGEGNDLSPALLRWELGPPAGVACAPFQIGGAGRLDPALATKVLLMEPFEGGSGSLDMTEYYLAQRQAILERSAAGEFADGRDMQIDDMRVRFRLYRRVSPPERLVPCE